MSNMTWLCEGIPEWKIKPRHAPACPGEVSLPASEYPRRYKVPCDCDCHTTTGVQNPICGNDNIDGVGHA